MGTINKGILGGFAGTVGTVIGGTWKGIDYMRSRPGRRSGTATLKQEEQRLRFGLIMGFIQPIGALLMLTFHNYAVRMTGTNSAVSYLLKNVVTGVYPNFTIDYALVLVSRGDLPNGGNPAASAGGSGNVRFTWTDNTGTGRTRANDKAVVVVYCPLMRNAIYITGGEERHTEIQNVNASLFSGKVVHTYIGFMSDDEKEVASSIYTGQLTVS